MPKLVLSNGEEVRDFVLKDGDILGRTAQCAIFLAGDGVSRSHCKFNFDGGSWFVEDLGSSNGTQVNGRKVSRFELADGDEIAAGSIKLRFLAGGPEAPAIEDSGAWGEDDLSLEEKHFLVLGFEGRRGDVLQLPEGRLTVGRNARHALIIKRASVSGDHAEIVREGSRVLVRDLGSSNGTFVDDSRVVEQELTHGAELRFGDSLVIYGKGDPQDIVLPAAEAPALPAATARADADEDAWNGDAAFELKAETPAGEKLWTPISVLAVLAVAGAGAWFFIFTEHAGGDATGPVIRRGANLLSEAAWSFESGMEEDPPLWERVNLLDPAEVECTSSGKTHQLSMARSAAVGTSLVGCRELLPVTGGTAWHVVARVTGDGRVALGARFSAEPKADKQALAGVFAEELVLADAAAGVIEGDLVVPEGASTAQVVIGLVGAGDALFDDVQIISGAEAKAPLKADEFSARQSGTGGVRITRLGARIIDGMTLIPVSPPASSPSAAGVTLEASAAGFTARFAGDSTAGPLEFRILTPQGENAIILQDGEKGRRVAEAVESTTATAVLLGQGGNRLRLKFVGADGNAERLTCTWHPGLNAPGQFTAKVSGAALRVDAEVRFDAERAAATALRNEAREAARGGLSGRAVERALTILERFPFDEDVVRECTQLVAEHSEIGRKALEVLTGEVDDLIFFRNWKGAPGLLTRVAADAKKHDGHAAGESLKVLEKRLADAAAAAHSGGSALASERLLARGRDYVELGRDTLARAFLAAVVERFPGTDSADEATQLLKQLEGKGGR